MTNDEMNKAVDKIQTFYKNVSEKHQQENKHFFFKEGGLTLYIAFKSLTDLAEIEKDYYCDENMIGFKLDNLRSIEELMNRLGIEDTFDKLNKIYYDFRGTNWVGNQPPFWACMKCF